LFLTTFIKTAFIISPSLFTFALHLVSIFSFLIPEHIIKAINQRCRDLRAHTT